jgi:probable HAF family extracellular repeat protein
MLVVPLLAMTSAASAQTMYSWESLGCHFGDPGGPATITHAMNMFGQVTGVLQDTNDVFRYDGNGIFTILTPGNPLIRGGEGFAINFSGQVAAALNLPALFVRTQAYIVDGVNRQRRVGKEPPDLEAPVAINDAGHVAGLSRGSATSWINLGAGAVDLGGLGGGVTQAAALNSLDQVVGRARIAPPTSNIDHAFLWQNGVMTDLGVLPGGSWSEARDINDSGLIVGNADNGTHLHAVFWQNGVIQDLTPTALFSSATAVNNAGVIVGQTEFNGLPGAFITEGMTLVDLNTRLTTPLPRAFRLDFPKDISDRGHVLVEAFETSQRCAFLLTPVFSSSRR